ncbi:MAG TPA: MFS transporter [Thermoplasmata archaeon]|nr:MFS transporter [Thermoplasmata archaeon]
MAPLPPPLRVRVGRFYAFTAASSFAIWIPFWTLWIRRNVSSDFEFALVDVAFWLGVLVYQLPVGILADRYGRKVAILLSEVFRTAGILGYGLSTAFVGYVVANLVWALGAAFSIGTTAYLYETLLEGRQESEFPRYIGRYVMIALSVNALGAFVGGVLVAVVPDVRLTMFVGAAWNLVTIAIVGLTFIEPKVERITEPTFTKQVGMGLRVFRRREGVALLIGLQVFIGVPLYAMSIFRPLYLRSLGFQDADVAVSISAFLLVAALVSGLGGRLARVLGEFGTIVMFVLLASASFLGMFGMGRFAAAAVLQAPLYVVWTLQPALTTAFLNRRLEAGERATVLSIGAMAYTLGLVAVEPMAGLLTSTTEDLAVLGLFLGLLTFFPCAYILWKWRTTVAPWPAVTPVPSRLVGGGRVSRSHRLFERLSRPRP